jgi:hypothetical protein
MGVAELVPPFFDLAGQSQQAVHGAGRAQIGAFIQEGGIDRSWGLVNEAFTVESRLLAFLDFQGPGVAEAERLSGHPAQGGVGDRK